MASIGIQYIGQHPLFKSLFIHGAGTENSAGVDDPAETIQNVGVRNTSKYQGIVGSIGEQVFFCVVVIFYASVTSPEFVICDDKTKELNVGLTGHIRFSRTG